MTMSPGTGDSAYGTGVDSAKWKGANRTQNQRKREIKARLFVVIPMKQYGSRWAPVPIYLRIKCSLAHRHFCNSFDKHSTHDSPTAQNRSDHGNANGSVTSTE
jgi:hypothetical protein